MDLLNYNFGFNRHNKKHLEKLKHVLSLDGPKRWRAASNFYLYLNPVNRVFDENHELVPTVDARTARRLAMQEAAEARRQIDLAHNNMGKSEDKNSSRRWGLHFPPGELQFIELIDPDVLSGTPQERRESVRKLAKEFKEYAIYTRI